MNERKNNSNKDNCMKINIIKPSEEEEIVNNFQNPNLLSINSPVKRRKSILLQKMENSYCIKKYTNENGTHGAKILKEYHKSKTINNPNAKESSSYLEYNTVTDRGSKNGDEQNQNLSQNQDISQNQDTSQNQSPKQNQNKIQNQIQNHNSKQEIKHNINYNININNGNPNDLLNILKLTNNIYSGESHLQKEIPTKKLNINNLTKFDNNFNNNNSTKNKLIIQFGLKNKGRRSYKSSKNFEPSIKKDTFSNYLNLKGVNEDEVLYENKIESSESDENNKINEYEHNITNNMGNVSSKSEKNSRFIFHKPNRKKSKSKFKKDKNKKLKKTKKESSKNTRKSSKSYKFNNDINKNNNISNKIINTIKEGENNEENKIDNSNLKNEKEKNENEKKKKNKFRFCNFFCCLNSG